MKYSRWKKAARKKQSILRRWTDGWMGRERLREWDDKEFFCLHMGMLIILDPALANGGSCGCWENLLCRRTSNEPTLRANDLLFFQSASLTQRFEFLAQPWRLLWYVCARLRKAVRSVEKYFPWRKRPISANYLKQHQVVRRSTPNSSFDACSTKQRPRLNSFDYIQPVPYKYIPSCIMINYWYWRTVGMCLVLLLVA